METVIILAVVLHFDFNGRDVSVLPEGKRRAYGTEQICKSHERTERARWRNAYPKPSRVQCESFEVRR